MMTSARTMPPSERRTDSMTTARLMVVMAGTSTARRPYRSDAPPSRMRTTTAATLQTRKKTPTRPISKRSMSNGVKVWVAPKPKP